MADPRQSGMTLLEILVALAILALGLAALFNSVSLGTRTASIADQQRAATTAAQSLLAELGRSRPIADGISEGAFSTGQSWRLDIEPLETPSAAPPVLQGHKVMLMVSWPENGQSRSIALSTLMLTAAPMAGSSP
jgi:type II secretion system protein I